MDEGWVPVAHADGRRRLAEMELVLRAMGIPHRVEHEAGHLVLAVPAEVAEAARRELVEYAAERARPRPREELPPLPASAWPAALTFGALLAFFYLLERGGAFGLDWWNRGMSDAGRVLGGEWWRAATSLTLHTDLRHLAGNAIFGAAYGVLFAQLVGSGVAWSAAFLAGFLGNLANAWVRGEGHRSVGASTAVFGLLGCLVVYEWRRRALLKGRLVHRIAPPILGLVLLAWFGVGGERTDVGAHVWGMLSGGVIGGAIGAALALRRHVRPWSAPVQAGFTAATLGALVLAWTIAFATS